MSDEEDGKTQTKEVLIDARGHLMVPDEFRQKYGSPKHYQNPTAYMKKDNISKVVQLIFEWPDGEIVKGQGE